jgi:Na+-transporting NADH:ubiquinone oxidoreductase subunit NqrE
VKLSRLRSGELVALAGAALVVVSLFECSYEAPTGRLDAWDTFGPTVALLIVAAAAALALVVSTLLERSVASPVALAVWCVPLGVIGVIAALVRVFERPQHATDVCIGAWLALAGALAILAGAWLALRDERTSRYEPANPEPRPRPR